MNIALYGPGRAGGSLILAASRAGHTIVSIDGRSASAVDELRTMVGTEDGEADVLVIAVADDAIPSVVAGFNPESLPPRVVHLSGAVSVDVLAPLAGTDVAIGCFHPLQTLPTATVGADRLPGSFAAITGDDEVVAFLERFAESIGCSTIRIEDADKPLYHAAAAAAANFTMTSLGIASELFEELGVTPHALRPLVDAIVANAFEFGARSAITGPIARGDIETVASQVAAVRSRTPELAEQFLSMARATAAFTGRTEEFAEVLR